MKKFQAIHHTLLNTQITIAFTATLLISLFVSVLISQPTYAATLNVNSTADTTADDGECTLREAIIAVNNSAASGATPGECIAGDGIDDIITLPVGTITLTNDLPALTAPMIIQGQGMGQTTIDADNGSYIVFSTDSNLTVSDFRIDSFEGSAIGTIDADLVVRRVEIDGTNALNDVGFLVGIAVLGSDPSLTVEDTYIHDISSDDAPAVGGVFMGVANNTPAEVIIRRSTIANMEGPATTGGLIFSTGAFDGNNLPASINATIQNNTITGISSLDDTQNSAAAAVLLSSFVNGGENTFNFEIANNTLNDVSHASNVGAVFTSSLFTNDGDDTINANLHFTNNILSSGSSFSECSVGHTGGGTANFSITSGGGNIAAGNSCSSVFADSTDQNNVTSIASTLGLLTDNGGYVPTMELQTGSAAIDAGVSVAGLTTDARGVARPQGVAYDSGAYELQLDENNQNGSDDGSLADTGDSASTSIIVATLLITPGLFFMKRYLTV